MAVISATNVDGNPFDGSSFFLPNFGLGLAPAGASAPLSAYTNELASTTADASGFPAAPTSMAPNMSTLGGLLGYNSPANQSLNNPVGSGLGFNSDTLKLVLGGIGTIGALWNAWEANRLAKKQFAFSKDFATANLNNQVKSYNNSLEMRARAIATYNGGGDKEARQYMREHRLDKPNL